MYMYVSASAYQQYYVVTVCRFTCMKTCAHTCTCMSTLMDVLFAVWDVIVVCW